MGNTGQASSAAAVPGQIAQRYRVIKALGHGGMAAVYHVVDEASGRELALKQLRPSQSPRRSTIVALFEAEFHTLAQLSHPRVVEVYDYGIADGVPFYTMELLDGGDLSERSPLPWREACALIYDVCSALALLHSRRFVHRDITPRNIRCTRDGRAKLIDFGTMVPMGHGRVAAGTPAFVAPEVVDRSALDGRADLFSLGATLYHALTRRAAYPARDFRELRELWKRRPTPPSSFDPQIPAALDALAANLLSPDPAMRPHTAFEVMQRLSAIAGLSREETLVSEAYLSTPTLVGRQDVLAALSQSIERAQHGDGGSCLLRAESGLGRSRVLDACVLEAKAHGAVVLRSSAGNPSGGGWAVAQALAGQLLEALGDAAVELAGPGDLHDQLFESVSDIVPAQGEPPARAPLRVKRFGDGAGDASGVLDALLRWLLRASDRQMLVITVDDLHRCDAASASLLTALAARADQRRLFLLLALEDGAPQESPDAVEALSGYCGQLGLSALTRAETGELLASVFGSAPNLGVLTEAIHEVARGNPGRCLDLAQHLIDRGVLRYAGGGWTLPERIDAAALPRTAEDAMQARIAALDPLACWLAQAHALSLYDSLSRDDYVALRPDADHQSIDRALLQLLSQQVLVSDGSRYAFARRSWAELLTAQLGADARQAYHRALAQLYEPSLPVAAVHHLLASAQRERGVAMLMAFVEKSPQEALGMWESSGRMRPADLLATFEGAHRAAIELGRPPRERIVTMGWIVGLSLLADDAYYFRYAPGWRAQLEHDSGFTLYQSLADVANPGERLMGALQRLAERFGATPEVDRVYGPEEAIRLLVIYVGVSIAVGSRCYDRRLLLSLPGLLEPFAPLSPLIEAVRLNALATLDVSCDCRLEQGRTRWIEVYERLMQIDTATLPAIGMFRNAVAFAIGMVEARIGIESAGRWAELLDGDPTQRVNALYLRKVICLHRGDFEGAERWRKQAEMLALQTPMRQMFTNVVSAELLAHAAAGDLLGVKQALERLEVLSARWPHWQAERVLAQAQYLMLCGDADAAVAEFERCLTLCTPDPHDPERPTVAWPSCTGALVTVLVQRGQAARAREVAERALALCEELGIGSSSHEIARGLALALARLGDSAAAWARLDRVLADQASMGVRGLQLGLTYETCARVAIWTADQERIKQYGRLAAIEYGHDRGSALGARYERLMEEVRSAGVEGMPELTELQSTALTMTQKPATDEIETMVEADERKQRAQNVLRILCNARKAQSGHLYLCSAGEIALAASSGGPPPDGLHDFLVRFMQAERADYASKTSIATDADLAPVQPVTSWKDPSGRIHHPLVLTGVVEGREREVGIVSFIDGDQPVQPIGSQLRAAVVAHLAQAGDAVPIGEPHGEGR